MENNESLLALANKRYLHGSKVVDGRVALVSPYLSFVYLLFHICRYKYANAHVTLYEYKGKVNSSKMLRQRFQKIQFSAKKRDFHLWYKKFVRYFVSLNNVYTRVLNVIHFVLK